MYYANSVIQDVIGADGNSTLFIGLVVYGFVVLSLAVLTLREQE